MDVVMRELEVCLGCTVSDRVSFFSDWLLVSFMQNFDLEGKEESADDEEEEEEEEEEEGKADWRCRRVAGTKWFV